MSLYLVHGSVMSYISFWYFGPLDWEGKKVLNSSNSLPTWTIPITVILSLIAATFVTLYIEEPARKYLKIKYIDDNSQHKNGSKNESKNSRNQ